MSTINAQNYGDGTDSVPASAVLEGTARVFAHYDQTAPAVRDSYNVSSITDTSSGLSDVNYTTALSGDDDGALVSGMRLEGSMQVFDLTTLVHEVITRDDTGDGTDTDENMTTRIGGTFA